MSFSRIFIRTRLATVVLPIGWNNVVPYVGFR